MLMTISAPSSVAAADAAIGRSSAANFAQASFDRSKALSVWPALSRFMAIGPPMLPRPMNAIFIVLSPLFLKDSGSGQRHQLRRHLAARAQVVLDEGRHDLGERRRAPL